MNMQRSKLVAQMFDNREGFLLIPCYLSGFIFFFVRWEKKKTIKLPVTFSGLAKVGL